MFGQRRALSLTGTLLEEGIFGRKVAPLEEMMSFMWTGSGLTDLVTWTSYPWETERRHSILLYFYLEYIQWSICFLSQDSWDRLQRNPESDKPKKIDGWVDLFLFNLFKKFSKSLLGLKFDIICLILAGIML